MLANFKLLNVPKYLEILSNSLLKHRRLKLKKEMATEAVDICKLPCRVIGKNLTLGGDIGFETL